MKRLAMAVAIFLLMAPEVLAATHRITVPVQQAGGMPLPGIPVELFTVSGSLLQRKTSNSTGLVTFNSVPKDKVTVTEGTASHSREITGHAQNSLCASVRIPIEQKPAAFASPGTA